MSAAAPFPINPALIRAIVIAYSNTKLIADSVMPRVPVGAQDFKYMRQNMADQFTVPETRVGRKSAPNQVESIGDLIPASVFEYGLDEVVPVVDIKNAPDGVDPIANAAEFVMKLILLDREVRVANTVFAPANHVNKLTLSGTSQWSDYSNSDPITALLTALDVPVMRPNVMTIGRAAWTKLILHPKTIDYVNGKGGMSGGVSRQQLADALELDEIQVGEAFVNTAKKGQTASYQRAWGKHCALTYRETPTEASRSTTWGFTPQFGERISDTIYSKDFGGLEGGYKTRAGERVTEVVSAPDLSYFFQNVVA
ncbi:phage capsid protein [Herbaspirillum rubrisubalbicans]|uniref:Phage capsid protein n=1 Tax=Herbaspirillum rubrisubalbicans TaxID=80842 RepID=A0AAD0UBJ1_9BURK|nr:phage capsid protein [Herbaspirillum rubrisubalbicans]AYR25771.1 phage capsid protein [Herbaspirillum rubrisubalbicans]